MIAKTTLRVLVLSFLVVFLVGVYSPATAASVDLNKLLHQYSPHLYTTKKEFSPPIAIEAMLENSYVIDTEINSVVVDDSGSPIVPDVDFLKAHDDEKYTIKLKKDYTKLFGKSKKENYRNSHPVVYGRATEDKENHLIALQYFMFYAGSYTGKLVVGVQMAWHEGDTEYAQVLLDSDTLKPVGASTSIHYYGSSKTWDECLVATDGRPKMYIAQHSHATYLAPSRWPGHQAMVGNLGFGGELMFSLKTVWDYCTEANEVDYKLVTPEESHPVFAWKGRWGGKEKLLPEDDSRKAHEPGPVSFAYRNAMSDSLSMWRAPGFFHFFYYMPTGFYQKLVLSINEIKDDSIKEQIFDLIYRIGRLRSKVDATLEKDELNLNAWQKGLLSEATPFVVLSLTNEKVAAIYESGSNALGANVFQSVIKSIASESVEDIEDSLEGRELPRDIKSNPVNLYTLSPSKLLMLLSKLTNVKAETIVEIYKSSHSMRNDDLSAFSTFDKLHIPRN